jgi:CheY-like chemotaxis protein
MKRAFSPERWAGFEVVGLAPVEPTVGGEALWWCGRCGDAYEMDRGVVVALRTHHGRIEEVVCPTCATIARRRMEGTALRRVLLVDDDPTFRDMVRRWIERKGVAEIIGHAADGLEAVHEVARLDPDVVVLDLLMPRRDGLEVLRQLPRGLEVIVLTGWADRGEEARQVRPDVTVLTKSTNVIPQLLALLEPEGAG